MTPENDDLALKALLAARDESAPDLDLGLLKQCYAIQRRHQFNLDRNQAVVAMERLVDQALGNFEATGDRPR